MTRLMQNSTAPTIPVNGIAWSWRQVGDADIDGLVPFVVAADPSGFEAAYWRREALSWLASDGCRGIMSVQCLAGLTLGLAFYSLPELKAGARRLVVERLRWLELARPHRSLDAVLAILIEHGRHHACDELLVLAVAAPERNARQALAERTATAGFDTTPEGWWRTL